MISATGNRMSAEIARQTRLSRAIADTQLAISTGKRIDRPSDDPAAAARIATLQRGQSDDAAWVRNIDLGASLAAQADGIARQLAERLARAQELVVSASSGTMSAGNRATVAAELRAIGTEIESLAATRSSLGQPLFASGEPRAMRFAADVVFAPVPSRTVMFSSTGQPLSQQIGDMADAIDAGDRGSLDQALQTAGRLVTANADAIAAIGTAAARLDRLKEANAARAVDLAAERSGLEDTDYQSAIATLNAQVLTLEAAQAAFARINRRTLIDMLA